VLVKSYKPLREHGSQEEIQTLRDEISEVLWYFGPKYAAIRAESERAKSNYESCVEQKKKYWKAKFGEKRGTAELAEINAKEDCEAFLDILNSRNEDFYAARSLIDRTDQILNSVSSRLKLVIKHE